MSDTKVQVELFPTPDFNYFNDPDSVEEVGLYDLVNLSDGVLVGRVGITSQKDEEYGYDALWGWATHDRVSDKPFRNTDEAVEDFIREVLV